MILKISHLVLYWNIAVISVKYYAEETSFVNALKTISIDAT